MAKFILKLVKFRNINPDSLWELIFGEIIPNIKDYL